MSLDIFVFIELLMTIVTGMFQLIWTILDKYLKLKLILNTLWDLWDSEYPINTVQQISGYLTFYTKFVMHLYTGFIPTIFGFSTYFYWSQQRHFWEFTFNVVPLKLVSAIFYKTFIFSPNDSPSKTIKNVFNFI